MNMRDINPFLDTFNRWAVNHTDIIGTALVGSYARGAAREDSDVDLMIITDTPQIYLQDNRWLETFGQVAQVTDEDWGLVQSKRVFYADGLEVEFGITTPEWVSINPIDDGTRRVITDGVRILSDAKGLLKIFADAVGKN
jgi:predicted nucleotidyltransferase